MAKGKSTFCTWYCTETGAPKKTTAYNKRNSENMVKQLMMYSKILRRHTLHKRKDTKKGNN